MEKSRIFSVVFDSGACLQGHIPLDSNQVSRFYLMKTGNESKQLADIFHNCGVGSVVDIGFVSDNVHEVYAYISEELVPKLLNRNNNMMNGALQKVEALQKELDAIQELAASAAGKLHQVDEGVRPG